MTSIHLELGPRSQVPQNLTTKFVNDLNYLRKKFEKPYFLRMQWTRPSAGRLLANEKTSLEDKRVQSILCLPAGGGHTGGSRWTLIEKLDTVLLWLHLSRDSPAISSHFAFQYGF